MMVQSSVVGQNQELPQPAPVSPPPAAKARMDSAAETRANPQMPPLGPAAAMLEPVKKVDDLAEEESPPPFKIAIVTDGPQTKMDRQIARIANPASSCEIAALVTLDGSESNQAESTHAWLALNNHRVRERNISLYWGEQGFDELLQRSDVEALFIMTPRELQGGYLRRALEAGKHVLLKDPRSTPHDEFVELLECSRRAGKFFQVNTMFLHQHRVKTFMDRVLREESFGRIRKIDAMLQLNYGDVEHVGATLPIDHKQGCIRVLGRYCVLFSTLVFSRVGSVATSAQVRKVQQGENGELISAECTVLFTQNRMLEFRVLYSTCVTRQNVEVQTDTRYATMTHFVIPHPDGLATYRVYDKERNKVTGKMEVVSAESIDIAGGPPLDVMMWRTFANLGRSVDEAGWDESPKTALVRELANVAIQTRRIIHALVESFKLDGAMVQLE